MSQKHYGKNVKHIFQAEVKQPTIYQDKVIGSQSCTARKQAFQSTSSTLSPQSCINSWIMNASTNRALVTSNCFILMLGTLLFVHDSVEPSALHQPKGTKWMFISPEEESYVGYY